VTQRKHPERPGDRALRVWWYLGKHQIVSSQAMATTTGSIPALRRRPQITVVLYLGFMGPCLPGSPNSASAAQS
jgi:hypothetical protein